MAYKQTQKITDSSASTDDQFGSHVSTDGRHLIVATIANPSDILFYERDGSSLWQLSRTHDNLAFLVDSVKMSNQRGVVGVKNHSSDAGTIYVYFENDGGPNNWGELYNYTPSIVSSGDLFGSSLDVDGKLLAVGAPGSDSNLGSVFLLTESGGAWNNVVATELTPIVRPDNALFGNAVAIVGSSVVVGARGEDDNTGAIYIFQQDNDNVWRQTQKIILADGENNDRFGWSISGFGDFFIVGAPNKKADTGASLSGATYIFKNINNSWEQFEKIININEETLENNQFGYSVGMHENFAIVGSIGTRGSRGVADIFSRLNGWNPVVKLFPDDLSVNDKFGYAVTIYETSAIVGSPGSDITVSDEGSIYVFRNREPITRLAQEFDIDEAFIPAKASVYLKRSGNNLSNYFTLNADKKNVIDVTNFETIIQKTNKIILDDRVSGFTGGGYLTLIDAFNLDFSTFKEKDYSVIEYPIKVVDEGQYNFWFRVYIQDLNPSDIENPSASTSQFLIDILLDGVVAKTIDEQAIENSWTWIKTNLIFSDTSFHTLGLRIRGRGNLLDKLYFDLDSKEPFLEGPANIESPFFTVHLRIFEGLGNSYPVNPLLIYDFKNSFNNVIQDDWYNFDIRVLDNRFGFTKKSNFTNNYFMVLSTSGDHPGNFVTWELVDNDEYLNLVSAFKY